MEHDNMRLDFFGIRNLQLVNRIQPWYWPTSIIFQVDKLDKKDPYGRFERTTSRTDDVRDHRGWKTDA
jgi:hypothetical protein